MLVKIYNSSVYLYDIALWFKDRQNIHRDMKSISSALLHRLSCMLEQDELEDTLLKIILCNVLRDRKK